MTYMHTHPDNRQNRQNVQNPFCRFCRFCRLSEGYVLAHGLIAWVHRCHNVIPVQKITWLDDVGGSSLDIPSTGNSNHVKKLDMSFV